MSERANLNDDFLTTRQAAKLLKVHISTLFRWVLSGKLPCWKRGGRYLVKRSDLEALLVPVKVEVPPERTPTRLQDERRTREVLRRHRLL